MALDARRRQQKTERRNAKQRAKRKVLARCNPSDLAVRFQRTAAAPILHCCTTKDLWSNGIAKVLVSRELSSGEVAFAAFLIDRYCLGVKDVFCDIAARSRYFDQVYEKLTRSGKLVPLSPAAARKLVEGAVEYARHLGLSPHGDYASARWIFGDIDSAASDREFEYGQDGKPFFISGPHDSLGRCHSIVGILSERCGPDGFHYIVHVPSPTFGDAELVQLLDDQEGDDSDDVIEGCIAQETTAPEHPRLPAPHASSGAAEPRSVHGPSSP